jgi:hypothetical protein
LTFTRQPRRVIIVEELRAAGLSRLSVLPVLAGYFFPWGAFVRALRKSGA